MRTWLLLFLWWIPGGLLAQLSEDFSDGDFTQNPSWQGDAAFFQVNAALELQSMGPAASETLHLATAQSLVAGTEWRFSWRYAFPPSSTNRMRFYLVSDQANLEGSLQGYYIEVGETGSNDTYRLYRQDGLAATELIAASPGLAGSGVDARLRVLRDQAGNWQLSVDASGSGQFVGQGSAFDATYTSSAWAGVWVQHTATRSDAFFFDDIYVGVPVQDTLPPRLTGLQILGPQDLALTFSEPLAAGPAQDPAHYFLSGGIGNPATASWQAASPAQVSLALATPLTDGVSYTLTLSNLADTAGNVLPAPVDTTFLYDIPDLPQPGEVILNEIMADPSPSAGLPEVEYVELLNASSKTFDLTGWTLSNGTVTTVLPPHTLGPGAFVLLVRQPDASQMSSFGPVLGLGPWTALVNTGDNLGLRSAGGLLLDTLDYTDDWYGNPAKAEGGYALERIDPNPNPCPPAANWIASTAPAGGTPGAVNSVFNPNPSPAAPALLSALVLDPQTLRLCFDQSMDPATLAVAAAYSLDPGPVTITAAAPIAPDFRCVTLSLSAALPAGAVFTLTLSGLSGCRGNALPPLSVEVARGSVPLAGDLIINELMPDPTPPLGLPEAEFVELFNRSERILELNQVQLSDGSSTVRLSPRIMTPGSYLILCAAEDSAAFAAWGPVLGLPFLPTLNNSSDSLFLRGPFEEPLDAVFYTSAWYRDADKANGGWSLERIDPDLTACGLAANWGASVAPAGGTPGQPNSLLGTQLEVPPLRLESWSLPDPQQMRLQFNQPLEPGPATVPGTYIAGPSLGVTAVTQVDGQGLLLTFSAPLDSAGTYALWAPGLIDCLGQPWEDTLVFGLTVRPTPYALRMHEIMADPSPRQGLPEGEYIELYNPGDRWLDLSGLRLFDNGQTGAPLGDRVLPPGGYLLLTTEADAPALADWGPVVGLSGFPSLGNSLDSLYLRDENGQVIDQVFYQDSWYRDPVKREGGWSLEQIDAGLAACDHSGNWAASEATAGGTPGRANSIAGAFTELSPPRLVQVTVPEPHVVSFVFDEPLDAAAVFDLNFYDLSGAPGFLVLIELAPGGRHLTFTFDAELEADLLYPLVFNGLPGCNGGLITEEVFVGLPQAAAPGDVLIHEILFNPYTGGSDFVEIINVSDKVIDLSTLRLGEGWPGSDSIYNDDPVSAAPVQLLPQQILCLTPDVDFQLRTYLPPGDARFLEMNSFPSYDDREGSCVVFTRDGVVLDRLDYLDDWQFPTLEDENGVSLERLSTLRPTQEADNWRSAAQTVRYATPGYPNSQRLAEAQAEGTFFLEPAVFSPDNDGQDDVAGIHYDLPFPAGNARVLVFDPQGRLIRTLRNNTLLGSGAGTFVWDGRDDQQRLAPLGAYVVVLEVTRTDTGERQQYRAVATLGQRL